MQLFTEKGDAAKHFLIRDDVILFVRGDSAYERGHYQISTALPHYRTGKLNLKKRHIAIV